MNWFVIPFIIKHFKTIGMREAAIIQDISTYIDNHYQNGWYLLKFMESNSNPDIQRLI